MATASTEQQKLDVARDKLGNAVDEAQKHFSALLKSSQAQFDYAKEQQVRWAKEMKALEAFKDDVSKPENNTYVSMELLHTAYIAMQRMQEIEIAAYRHNLDIVGPKGALGHGTFQVPGAGADYAEQSRRMDLATSRYLVRFNIQGIDTVLRATYKGNCINPVSDAQRTERENAAKALRVAAEASVPVNKFLEQLATDLKAVRTLNKWGIESFAGWGKLDVAAKQALIKDARWARFEELVPLLQHLHERSETCHPVQELFLPWVREKLPFSTQKIQAAFVGDATGQKKGSDHLNMKSGSRSSFKLP